MQVADDGLNNATHTCTRFLLGFHKKVKALAKQKDCELIGKWEQSMINHMYWCVVSTPNGDGDMMVAKWLSLENHIHNTPNMVNCFEVALVEGLLDKLETRNGLSGVTSYVYVQNSTIRPNKKNCFLGIYILKSMRGRGFFFPNIECT